MDEHMDYVKRAMMEVASSDATPPPVRDWLTDLLRHIALAEDNPRWQKGAPLPSNIGALADEYAEVRDHRLEMDKAAARVKERETEIFNIILSALEESPDTGASGQHHRVQRVVKTVQNVADWPALYQFIQTTGAFEMLQRRLSDKAASEWAEANGALPPGVKAVDIATLSFTKI